MPDGEYKLNSSCWITPMTMATRVTLRASLIIEGDEMTVDLSENPEQVGRAINNPWNNTLAVVYKAIYQIVDVEVPFSEGFARPIKVIAPSGTILNPTFPAAGRARGSIFLGLQRLVFMALAQAVPERVPVPSSLVDLVHMNGVRPDGSSFSAIDVVWNSWGARPTKDGIDGAGEAAQAAASVEIQERYVPVVIEEVCLRADTGGPGQFRGGDGIAKQYRFLQDAEITLRTNSFAAEPFGLGAVGVAHPPGTSS